MVEITAYLIVFIELFAIYVKTIFTHFIVINTYMNALNH